MFHLLKGFIWLAGLAVLAYIVINFLGYEVNRGYFDKSKEKCQERLNECTRNLVEQGTKNAKCNFICVEDPKFLIKKK